MNKIGIVNIGLGNVNSVYRAIKYLGYSSEMCSEPNQLKKMDKIILPGVGNFSAAMDLLNKKNFTNEISHLVNKEKRPILGICLGMQLLCSIGYEGGKSIGLSLINGKVEFHRGAAHGVIIPHIGWNDVRHNGGVLYNDIDSNPCFYFVHSYEVIINNSDYNIGITNHGVDFVASFEKNHIFGVQFHPEKSQEVGLKIIKNFIEL